jgi:hypothetical protein
VTHPTWPRLLGGLGHLPAAEQARVHAQVPVPPHLCCEDPAWLYRIYQDTDVDVAAVRPRARVCTRTHTQRHTQTQVSTDMRTQTQTHSTGRRVLQVVEAVHAARGAVPPAAPAPAAESPALWSRWPLPPPRALACQPAAEASARPGVVHLTWHPPWNSGSVTAYEVRLPALDRQWRVAASSAPSAWVEDLAPGTAVAVHVRAWQGSRAGQYTEPVVCVVPG